jgi:hypothetical protein
MNQCLGDTLSKCAVIGQPPVPEPCSWGCSIEGEAHCRKLQPSGGVLKEADLDPSPGLGPLSISNATINTETGEISPQSSISFEMRGNVGVFRATKITISGNVQVKGKNALALVSTSDVTVSGTIDVQGACSGTVPGPGGGAGGARNQDGSGSGAGGQAISASSSSCFGAGGGGNGGNGGRGGNRIITDNGGKHFGEPEMLILVGGGGGGGGNKGNGVGGGGGGAVQIIANGQITIATGGGIKAGGCGGKGSGECGGGGGAGGTILLEAPVILFDGSKLAVNGGGGAGGNGDDGDAAWFSSQVAGGGGGSSDSGDGGDGGHGHDQTANGSAGGDSLKYGGGGGGGVGLMRFNTLLGNIVQMGSNVFSPPVSTGTTTGTARVK